MEFTDLSNLIKDRRSIRCWQDKPVPEELLTQAVELATWAPSGGNQQNWHFYIIVNRDTIGAIADAVQAKADQIASWPEADKLGDVARFRDRAAFFRGAPALIAVAAAQYQSAVDLVLTARDDLQAARIHEWRNMANSRIQSVASAIAYLLLIFHQMGLGAVWMTGPMQAKEDIEKILKVSPEMDIVALIPVGYPDESRTSSRRPVGEVSEIVR